MKKDDAKSIILQEWRAHKLENKNWGDSDMRLFIIESSQKYNFKTPADNQQLIRFWVENDPTNKLDRP